MSHKITNMKFNTQLRLISSVGINKYLPSSKVPHVCSKDIKSRVNCKHFSNSVLHLRQAAPKHGDYTV